jgi:hypothetical protein
VHKSRGISLLFSLHGKGGPRSRTITETKRGETFSYGAQSAYYLAFLGEDPRRGGDGRCSEDTVVAVQWSSCAGGASRHCSPPSLIGLGFEVGNSGGDEPHILSCHSPPPLYRAVRRGPTSLVLGWAPNQDARSRD